MFGVYIHTHTHIHRMDYCSVIKKNILLDVTIKYVNLKVIMLSEISQTCKYK
jgi:calcineurin-like phosphoesterase family protein